MAIRILKKFTVTCDLCKAGVCVYWAFVTGSEQYMLEDLVMICERCHKLSHPTPTSIDPEKEKR